jgi:hypothetical protein
MNPGAVLTTSVSMPAGCTQAGETVAVTGAGLVPGAWSGIVEELVGDCVAFAFGRAEARPPAPNAPPVGNADDFVPSAEFAPSAGVAACSGVTAV